MAKKIIPLIILFCFSINIYGQLQDVMANTKRKKVEVPNYTLFLHLHDLAIEYSTKLDYKTDSLFALHQVSYEKNLFDFRIRTLQTLQHVLYKSDPVIAFIDGWVFGLQMSDYLQNNESKEYLGYSHTTLVNLFDHYLQEFPDMYVFLTGNDAAIMLSRVTQFAKNNPISDHHLNRTSITDATAQWVGQATIGFKSGVSTLTDALRNISDRVNYYTEFTPKLTQWYIERSIGRIIGTDSIGPSLEKSVAAIERMSYMVDSIDHLIYSVTDTVLTNVDRQRWETLHFIRAERKAIMEQISLEREAVLGQITEERKALENLIREERQASFDQIQSIVEDTTEYSFDRVDKMVDRLFLRVLILMAIIAIGLVLAMVVYKKL